MGTKSLSHKYGLKTFRNIKQAMGMWTGRGEWGGMDWEIRFDINILLCVEQMASGKLLQSTGGSPQCSVMTWSGEDGGWGGRG